MVMIGDYLGVSGYGWFVWQRSRGERPRDGARRSDSGIRSSWSGPAQLAIWAVSTMVLALAMAIYGFVRWIREEPAADEPMAEGSMPGLATGGDPA